MAWPESTVRDWEDFQSTASRLAGSATATQFGYLCRGQSRSEWRLTPSLHRTFPASISAADALAVEQRIEQEFFAQAHLHVDPFLLDPQKAIVFERWALLQHVGAPTRLLDWTSSPYVGAYFAVEGDWDADGALWLIHGHDVLAHALEAFDPRDTGRLSDSLRPDSPKTTGIFNSHRRSERIVAQQGLFTVCRNILGDQHDLLDEACAKSEGKPDTSYRKIIIPKALKPTFVLQLRAMNVTAASLFPGADGLGRSMREMARLAAHFPANLSPLLRSPG